MFLNKPKMFTNPYSSKKLNIYLMMNLLVPGRVKLATHCPMGNQEIGSVSERKLWKSTCIHHRKRLASHIQNLIMFLDQNQIKIEVIVGVDERNSRFMDLDKALQDDTRISYHRDYLSNLSAAIR